jgi:DnaJ-class molecular chaperone
MSNNIRLDAASDQNPGDEAPPGTVGSGEDVCPHCHGSGKMADGPCEVCGGTGKIIRGIGGG